MKPNPYPYKRIFAVIESLDDCLERVAKRNAAEPNVRYAGADTYQRMYQELHTRLQAPDMLTLEQAAAKLAITPRAYKALANKGEVMLISVGNDIHAVPDWAFDQNGAPDALKNDIGREYAAGQTTAFFKCLDYLKFMTDATIEIAQTIPEKTLQAAFHTAGTGQFKCLLSVKASPLQLVEQRGQQPAFFDILTHHLHSNLTRGGFGDTYGGLSRPFRDKYNVPGLTYDEEMQEYIRNHPRP